MILTLPVSIWLITMFVALLWFVPVLLIPIRRRRGESDEAFRRREDVKTRWVCTTYAVLGFVLAGIISFVGPK